MAERIQRKRTKGWRMPDGAVSVSRPGKWGNPFKIEEGLTAQGAVNLFRSYLLNGMLSFTVDDVRRELKGKNLACWCRPDGVCHADVLLEIANSEAV
jgi:hypothetical protein